jgi:hypothetical protein
MTASICESKKFEKNCKLMLVSAKMNMMRRAFRMSNPQICGICKNDYLPGQIIFDRTINKISCIECDFESTFYTKIYPGQKSPNFYTPFPSKEDDQDEEKEIMETQDMSQNKRRPKMTGEKLQ